MTWPTPAPGDIANRAAAVFETELGRIYFAQTGVRAEVDARTPNSPLTIYCRVLDMSGFDLYIDQRRIADEMMLDKAQDWLPRHGNLWGVPRGQPVASTGNALFSGTPLTTTLPALEPLTSQSGASYITTAAVTLGADGTGLVPVAAVVAGTAGNLASGAVLSLVSPIGGLIPQAGIVDANGVTGGQDLEDIEVWRSRIKLRVRRRGAGGSGDDYEQWVREVLPTAIVSAFSPGSGAVIVVIVMPGPRVPTDAELALATAYVTDAQKRKPLTAQVNVIAGTLHPIDVTLHLNPDTVDIRAGAEEALEIFFATDGAIGGTIEVSRLDNTISTLSGEISHDRTLPAADITVGPTEFPTVGVVDFV